MLVPNLSLGGLFLAPCLSFLRLDIGHTNEFNHLEMEDTLLFRDKPTSRHPEFKDLPLSTGMDFLGHILVLLHRSRYRKRRLRERLIPLTRSGNFE